MKVVYIAGPYRADTEYGVHANIQAAENAARLVWGMGAAALCPHKNSAYLGGIVDAGRFLAGGIELMRRSDAVLLLDGWEESRGSRIEQLVATEEGMPVLRSLVELGIWLADQDDGEAGDGGSTEEAVGLN